MERLLVSHKKHRLQVFFLLLFFVPFLILSQSAWGATLNLQATWTPPTKNSDGTPLTDLGSYNLYETNSTDSPSARTLITNISKTAAPPYSFSVTVPDSSSGTLYFVITAVDKSGNESADSAPPASYTYNLTPPTTTTCTVATNPSGLQVTVDAGTSSSTTCITPCTYTWNVGDKHPLAVTSPQNGTSGVQYIFAKWDDNGSTSKTRTITVPSTSATYTADFTIQYSLTTSVNPPNAGTVTPAGTTWYNSGKSVSVSAKPNSGYTLTNWSGASGTNPLPLTMNGPMTVVANFTAIPEELSTPTTPKNVTNGFTGTSYTFSSKSTSSLHNPVQYQYDWGDGTTSAWGPATQSHFWISVGNYQVTVTARSATNTSMVSIPSASASVKINEKPFIHITSPNGGETWVMGATHNITWDSNYLDQNGTIYLYYWYGGLWHPIISLPMNSNTGVYSWTIPTNLPAPPSSAIPKSHMAWTSIYIGNWVNGAWQCWDTNDKSFKILDNGWAFTISGADKGGATLFFNTDESSFDGYGISFNVGGLFKIQGTYTVGANGLINGTYQLSDYLGNPLPNGTGNITGTLNLNATTMTLTLKNQSNVSVFSMSGVWLSELAMPESWSVQISGSAKGTISPNSPLMIGADPDYTNVFEFNGSGMLADGSANITIVGGFFFTPLKTVYGFYQLTIGSNPEEEGRFSGTLNPNRKKFTFNLTSSNGHKYTFAGVATQ